MRLALVAGVQVQVVQEVEVLDAGLDSRVGIRRGMLYQSLALAECRHVGGSYHYLVDYYLEEEDDIRR